MAFHFLAPFVVAGVARAHLIFLHSTGSSNPVGLNSTFDAIPFHPYFSTIDALVGVTVLATVGGVRVVDPWTFGDPENFLPADGLVTPVHIKPEWYFLFAYTVLRSIPNKLGGVLALVASVAVLITLSISSSTTLGAYNSPSSKMWF